MPQPIHAAPRSAPTVSAVRRAVALGVLALAAAACMPDEGADPNPNASAAGGTSTPPGYAPAVEPSGARRVARLDGFLSPESVKYDAEQDVYFVTNILGYGSVKDGNGYIVKVSAADPSRMEVFAEGGKNGVVLDAPKGTALHGDTLWVADIDHLRGFDRHDGRMLADVDFAPQHALMLNDVDVGPDGTIHVTDTGIHMTDKGVVYTDSQRVFVVGPNRSVTTQAQGPALGHPNGIKWDASGKRWIVVSFDPFRSDVYAMRDGDSTRTVLAQGKGRFDGLELLDDGRMLVTCWNDSTVHAFGPGGRDEPIVRHLSQPADLGLDTRRHRIAVPLGMLGRVEIWQLPTTERTVARR